MPDFTDITTEGRAKKFADLAKGYCGDNDDPYSNLVDLLADAMHHCGKDIDFDDALALARRHYETECNEEERNV